MNIVIMECCLLKYSFHRSLSENGKLLHTSTIGARTSPHCCPDLARNVLRGAANSELIASRAVDSGHRSFRKWTRCSVRIFNIE